MIKQIFFYFSIRGILLALSCINDQISTILKQRNNRA
ncbi:hypothetical protein MGSAQ_002323 [marine sediment metagenome]|uniref:Uncharacterized protein n=1 Tax=marine sediment metagenome TaxID=412755 RepID=A0A1B6NTC3_9ZZZZ